MQPHLRFGLMVLTSTVAMFGLVYLNTFELEHVFFSETRMYMALLMGAAMALIMLAFMRHMLYSRKVNAGIALACTGGASRCRSGWFAARRRSTTSPT